MKKKRTQVTGIITDRVVCQMPGREIIIEKVDDDGFYILVPLGRGRELYLYGGDHGDLSLDLHPSGEDSCCLATFDEVVALINGDRAAARSRENSTQPVPKRSARKSRRSK